MKRKHLINFLSTARQSRRKRNCKDVTDYITKQKFLLTAAALLADVYVMSPQHNPLLEFLKTVE